MHGLLSTHGLSPTRGISLGLCPTQGISLGLCTMRDLTSTQGLSRTRGLSSTHGLDTRSFVGAWSLLLNARGLLAPYCTKLLSRVEILYASPLP